MASSFLTRFNFKLLFGYFNQVKPTRFFVVAAIFFQLVYTCVTPPLQAPDELNHFYRAYRIAEGSFLPEKINNRLGGQIPLSMEEFILPFKNASTNFEYKINRADLLNSFSIYFSEETEFRDFPNTSYYSPVSYLPQALAIFIFKKMNCSIGTIYYAGRVSVFLLWLLCMFFVIKMIPLYKWLFTLLALLPMNMYIANSFSADTMTGILSFLFIAFVLKLTFSDRPVGKKEVILIFTIISLLALAKVVYVGLVVLLFIIPKSKFSSRQQQLLFFSSVTLVAGLMAWIWSGVVMHNYLSYANYNSDHRDISSLVKEADYYAQKNYILNNGLYFFKVFGHSVFHDPQIYLCGYIGCFGTYMDVPLPVWLCSLAFIIILFLALFEKNRFTFSIFQKVIIFLAAGFTFTLLLLSQHLTWDAVGSGIVGLLQGRYFIPVFPLLFILFNNKQLNLRLNTNMFVIVGSIFINGYAMHLIYERFVKETFCKKTEFYCDAETVINGRFKTSDPAILLDNGSSQTTAEHKSGNFSAVLGPGSPYCFAYSFKGLNVGDLVEIEAWQKGNDGQLIISGGGKGCEDFYFPNNQNLFKDKNGWSKMQFIFTMPEKCDSSVVSFFIWNASDTKVYFDDIRFCLKQFKPKP